MSLEQDSSKKPLEPFQCIRPARLVQGMPSLGCERSLIEHELRSFAIVEEGERHHRLLVVGIRFLPYEREDKAPRRIDLQILPRRWNASPSGGCMVIRNTPPTRTSRSTL